MFSFLCPTRTVIPEIPVAQSEIIVDREAQLNEARKAKEVFLEKTFRRGDVLKDRGEDNPRSVISKKADYHLNRMSEIIERIKQINQIEQNIDDEGAERYNQEYNVLNRDFKKLYKGLINIGEVAYVGHPLYDGENIVTPSMNRFFNLGYVRENNRRPDETFEVLDQNEEELVTPNLSFLDTVKRFFGFDRPAPVVPEIVYEEFVEQDFVHNGAEDALLRDAGMMGMVDGLAAQNCMN